MPGPFLSVYFSVKYPVLCGCRCFFSGIKKLRDIPEYSSFWKNVACADKLLFCHMLHNNIYERAGVVAYKTFLWAQ